MPSDADSRHVYERLGEAGWIGLHWPQRLGGRDLGPLQTSAVEEVFGYHWLPLSSYLLSVKTIGNALLRFAAPDLVERLLPQIASGELVFCQGFSEPDAGSDLAALRTRAVLDGDRYIVNGRKIWTSSAERADWVYLAVRTDPDVGRHRGLSVLVADMRSPGIEIAAHPTLGGGTLGELLLEDVEVPADQIVGDRDGGWQVLMGTMDFERITSEKVGVALWLLDNLRPLVATSAQAQELRRLYGEARASRLHGERATGLLAVQAPGTVASSMAKLAVARLMQRLAAFSVNLLGPAALIEQGPGALLGGRVAAFHRAAVATTIAGGASDIQRRVIARHGFGLAP
jgi:alkylation response protein AidB-like acyl-CoA dehydrogenase